MYDVTIPYLLIHKFCTGDILIFDEIVFIVFCNCILLSHHYFNVIVYIKILLRETNTEFYYIRNNTKDHKRNFIHKKVNMKKCKHVDNVLVIRKLSLNS